MANKSKLAAKGFKAAQTAVEVPDYCAVNKGAEPYLEDVLRSRANWSRLDMVRAVELANLLHSNDVNSALLLETGLTYINHRGDPIGHPLHRILIANQRLAIALSGSLQVTTTATTGRSGRDAGNLNAAAQQARNTLDNHESEDSLLIPGLSRMRAVK